VTPEFLAWAGMTPIRWAQLQDILNELARIEHTPARVIQKIHDHPDLLNREQLVLVFWLGYLQGSMKSGLPISTQELMLKARLN